MWSIQNITVALQAKKPVEIALPDGASILNFRVTKDVSERSANLMVWGSDASQYVCPRTFWFLEEGHRVDSTVSGKLHYIGTDSERQVHLFEERI